MPRIVSALLSVSWKFPEVFFQLSFHCSLWNALKAPAEPTPPTQDSMTDDVSTEALERPVKRITAARNVKEPPSQ